MSTYASTPSIPKAVATDSYDSTILMNSKGRTTSQKLETKFIQSGFFSGVFVAAFFAFANVGASTTPTHNNLNTVIPSIAPVISRSETSDENENENENENRLAHGSDELRGILGLNTAQWAKILKVERKTVYNWRSSPETKIKNNAAERLKVITKFAEEFNPEHSDFFSKFMFGRNANVDLLNAFLSDPMDLQEMLNQYDNIYTKLDGFVKRAALLG
ncbi:hypothetical protein RI049_09640 [Cedecea neteri]|uniref:hypothetical protein n=1 Tax=Cedecea neteri TaxID=158822 RepID=UPI002AA614F7|nr:hypothetical protein [Cedecea neteri]WPU24975.1 hypothetical protein RI049_09640 [Cedecea neteri]